MTESDTEEQITEEVVEPVIDEVEEPTETDIEPVDEQVETETVKQEITENEQVAETDNEIDNKKDIVMEKSNVERIIDTLGDFYKTPDKLKYFYENCKEWVDKINQADYKELAVSTYASQIKLVINKKFDYPEVAAITNTKKEVKPEFEGCFM